jgi:hypothetical protein
MHWIVIRMKGSHLDVGYHEKLAGGRRFLKIKTVIVILRLHLKIADIYQ